MLVKTETQVNKDKFFLPKSWQTNKAASFLDYVNRKWPTQHLTAQPSLPRHRHTTESTSETKLHKSQRQTDTHTYIITSNDFHFSYNNEKSSSQKT